MCLKGREYTVPEKWAIKWKGLFLTQSNVIEERDWLETHSQESHNHSRTREPCYPTTAQPQHSNRYSSTAVREEPSQETSFWAVNKSRHRCCCYWEEIHQRLSSGYCNCQTWLPLSTAVDFVAARLSSRKKSKNSASTVGRQLPS